MAKNHPERKFAMIALGLDIGTTTVSAAAIQEDGRVLSSRTLKNDSTITGAADWERIQQPERIFELSWQAIQSLLEEVPEIACIGVTGQMHGIVYLDSDGNPVSPLYTWQDRRGDLPWTGSAPEEPMSRVQRLSALSGYPAATGFGLATHFCLSEDGLIPKNAVCFCTIGDYVAMKLAGLSKPLVDASNAASMGLFSLKEGQFDKAALKRARLSESLLPELAQKSWLGSGSLGIPVAVAIGDNQASYLGAASGGIGHVLVNIGTGSQFSAHMDSLVSCSGLEARPFPLGGYLLVGSSLCGGRAYALMEHFFRQTAEIVTGNVLPSCYDAMERLLETHAVPEDIPFLRTTFQGTRRQPDLRGSIEGLSVDNFTPLHLLYGVMRGMAAELYEMDCQFRQVCGTPTGPLIGSGNGLRRNPHLQRILGEIFGSELVLSPNEEEASCGAALFALHEG